jgi:small conductance mechanosensitive channel
MDELWQRLEAGAITLGGRLLGALVIGTAGWLILRYLMRPLRRALEHRLESAAASFLFNTGRALVLVALLLAVLQQLGVQTASLLALLGAAGLAIALSLQSSLANFASGIIVLAFRLIRVGDQIEIGDVRGRVCEMLPFHVILETPDNQRIVVPNTMLTGSAVRNNSALLTRRTQWSLPVSAKADLAAAKEALRQRLLADGRVLREPGPAVFVQEWGEEKRVLAAQAWAVTANVAALQQDMLEELGKALEAVPRS